MIGINIGYARVSTEAQHVTAQRDGLRGLGVEGERIYVDHGLTGRTRERPGLREALAACRSVETLVVTKLDRLARSLPDARAIADELTARQVKLSLGGRCMIRRTQWAACCSTAMVAEFEADLAGMRTWEGMKVGAARRRGMSTS